MTQSQETPECNHYDQKSAVINGKFIKLCDSCANLYLRIDTPGAAQYARDKDRREYEGDMIQPWHNGNPNPDFIRTYPQEAKEYFTDQQLKDSGV